MERKRLYKLFFVIFGYLSFACSVSSLFFAARSRDYESDSIAKSLATISETSAFKKGLLDFDNPNGSDSAYLKDFYTTYKYNNIYNHLSYRAHIDSNSYKVSFDNLAFSNIECLSMSSFSGITDENKVTRFSELNISVQSYKVSSSPCLLGKNIAKRMAAFCKVNETSQLIGKKLYINYFSKGYWLTTESDVSGIIDETYGSSAFYDGLYSEYIVTYDFFKSSFAIASGLGLSFDTSYSSWLNKETLTYVEKLYEKQPDSVISARKFSDVGLENVDLVSNRISSLYKRWNNFSSTPLISLLPLFVFLLSIASSFFGCNIYRKLCLYSFFAFCLILCSFCLAVYASSFQLYWYFVMVLIVQISGLIFGFWLNSGNDLRLRIN